MIALDLPYGGRPSRRSFHAPGGVSALKSHNILIEPWQETSSFTYERGERLFRWTVSYEQDGVRFGQGTARTHTEARQDRKSTRLNSSHYCASRMPYSA